ncbi:hypothetical protein YC2023_024424 [Brassica napus]
MEKENWIYGKVWDQEGNPKKPIHDEEVTSEKLSADFLLSQEDDYRRRRCIYLKSYSLKKAKSNADIRRHISTARKFLYQLKKLVRCGHQPSSHVIIVICGDDT